ncbi:hypothetical protein TSUD_204790 [Trifolium subterraneum]|uniref:HAT C-terminal dimerisation domain-containing protein n=1 Tax=Trifolium subterraneum TaxID=3900 RepID=A0A2Z6MZ83_TRISU|nr:hypothetical protein TSUD_204790 [Trifolium subterraneum]
MQVWKVQCILEKNQNSVDGVIKDMSKLMKEKFDKYWKDYSEILEFGAILDPCLKEIFLRFCYTRLDASTSQAKLKKVMDKFKVLYEEYVSCFANESVSLSQSSYESSTLSKPSNVWNKTKKSKIAMDLQDFKTWSSNESSTPGKSELELYFEDKPMQLEEENSEDFEVLLYWKLHEKKIPTLSIMAQDILSIPITIVASESSFSIGGRVLTKYRSSTLPEHIQMLICTQNWLHGFTEYINDDDECNIVDDCNTTATMTQHG